jgi:hypothetical protein
MKSNSQSNLFSWNYTKVPQHLNYSNTTDQNKNLKKKKTSLGKGEGIVTLGLWNDFNFHKATFKNVIFNSCFPKALN